MATQHPDNAGSPWWKDEPFVSTQEEIDEVTTMFKELSIDEYMWDWEGKYVDEAVGEKLFSRAAKFFAKHPLGSDVHLTYRIPAFDGEKMHRMARAMMNVLALADLGHDLGLRRPPVTEMFLPLTTSASQPMKVRSAFKEVAKYHGAVFHDAKKKRDTEILNLFEVTPLVEDTDSLLTIEKILKPYWQSLMKERNITDQRIFFARSDPAMNAGIIPAVLAVKVAISTAYQLGESLGIRVHPIVGTGSLPFRGSVNPSYVESFLTQYAGVRTYTIQSAFRYDYPKSDVEKALQKIRTEVPKRKPIIIPDRDIVKIKKICKIFTDIWKPTIEAIAPLINDVAAFMPRRRERLQHIGLFGYSRGVGKVRLPRAIGFTGALYSVGIPPEFIATGRGLLEASTQGLLETIEQYYPSLLEDLKHAGKYLNRENLHALSRKKPIFREIERDIDAIEKILKIAFGPEKPRHEIHRGLTSIIYQRLTSGEYSREVMEHDIVEAGVIRRSIG